MKSIIRPSSALSVLIFLAIHTSYAQIGCMARTTHGDTRRGYDHKMLHFVCCACDCARHKHLERRLKCEKCGHYVKHVYRDIF